MRLTFEYTQELGQGFSPQAIHMMDNGIQLIYLTADGTVRGTEAFPALGLYDSLSFTEKGRISADMGVTKPSLKKVAHYGAYGFWCADAMHKFVMYMLPTDVSHTLLNGSISYSKGSPISQFSINLQNAGGELVGRYRSIIAPNTKLELYFSLGGSAELSLGQFYIDRVSIGYPEQSISVTARNAIGKLLKEQTFNEDVSFTAATLQENLTAILTLAEVENFFVADPQKSWKLTFESQTALLDGVQNVIQLLPGWQISENTDGTVGIGPVSDGRFEQPSTYIFERDKTCWSYDVEYDDEQTVCKICIACKEPANTVFRQLPPHKWWVSPPNKTLYITVPDGTSLADMNAYADELTDSVAVSGRIESFAGIFTPHMLIGDAVELLEPNGSHSMIGTVTSVKHNIGRNGFYTEFTVDSGGRKGKPFLKDFVSQISGRTKTSGVVIS